MKTKWKPEKSLNLLNIEILFKGLYYHSDLLYPQMYKHILSLMTVPNIITGKSFQSFIEEIMSLL